MDLPLFAGILLSLLSAAEPAWAGPEEGGLSRAIDSLNSLNRSSKPEARPCGPGAAPRAQLRTVGPQRLEVEHFRGRRTFTVHEMAEPRVSFPDRDRAAIAFVDFVRAEFPKQFVEYCAYLVRDGAGGVTFRNVTVGSPGSCAPLEWPVPRDAVGLVHTHPQHGERRRDLAASDQIFSETDYEAAESLNPRIPVYLGAPAGHVLRYDPGQTECQGENVRHRYVIVRKPAAAGRLLVSPEEFRPVPGASQAAYCRNH
ncbi:MAG: DUF4329 domain-containing protein [Oligoflexia bacterium]|nr:DUF4329 domain-containing protein [Oligoflexia bacterium]